jgi:hypothetical protein
VNTVARSAKDIDDLEDEEPEKRLRTSTAPHHEPCRGISRGRKNAENS